MPERSHDWFGARPRDGEHLGGSRMLGHNGAVPEGAGVATDLGDLQSKLWEAADQLRANSSLKASEYASPVLGLIFLRYADQRFAEATEFVGPGSERRPTGPEDYQATGALYLPEESRFETLLELPEDADIGKAINQAMGGIEVYNPDLSGVLPKDYSRIPDDILAELLRLLRIPAGIDRGRRVRADLRVLPGQVRLRRARRAASSSRPPRSCASSWRSSNPSTARSTTPPAARAACSCSRRTSWSATSATQARRLSIYGQEKTATPFKLAKMNLAVHGLGGDIREGQHLLRGPPRLGRPVRLRDGQPPVQRRQDRQGQARRRPAVPASACRGPTTATTCGSRPSTSAL